MREPIAIRSSEFGVRSEHLACRGVYSAFRIPHSALRQALLYPKGFTLVELMVVSILFLILGGGLLTAFLTGQTSYLSAEAYIQVQQEARRAFDNVVRELRESGRISCGEPPVVAGTCTSPRLNFQAAKGYDSGTGTIQWGNDLGTGLGNYLHYAVIGAGNQAQLIRFQGLEDMATPLTCTAPNCRVLANSVNTDPAVIANLFQWDDANDIVAVRLEILTQNFALPGGSQKTGVLTSRVRLRNNS